MSASSVRVGAVEIAYEDLGRGPRPLVLVHGFTGTRRDFATVWDALARDGRVLVPDLRGHGESSRGEPGGYDLHVAADDLVGWLDALGVDRCDLLGHSMGGMVALRIALAHPERVASLVLMSTSASAVDFDRSLFARAVELARAAGMPALAQVMRARAAEDPTRPEADRRVEREWGEERFWHWRTERVAAMDPEAYAAFGRALGEAPSLLPRLGAIVCPTLVLVGEADREFRGPADDLARGIPGARQVVLPAAAHQPQHEAPEAWLAAVRDHLARVRGA